MSMLHHFQHLSRRRNVQAQLLLRPSISLSKWPVQTLRENVFPLSINGPQVNHK